MQHMEYTFISLDSVDSTNSYAKEHCRSYDPTKITCITAEEQTAGRGRLGRKWISPRGKNIYATLFFQLPATAMHLISLAQIMTFSLAKILLNEGLSPKIKWPNDVQLNGKKLSGVLCETSFHDKTVDLFLGIGLNVNMEAELLSHVGQPATSLMVETRKEWDRTLLLKKLLKQFAKDLESFKKGGFTPFHNQYENLLAYKGHTIHCFDGQKEWVGICHSITNDGQLNLYLPNKEILTLSSGDLLTAPEGS